MSGWIRLKLGGMIKGMQENVLSKFFDLLTRVRSVGHRHRCLIYAMGMT